MSNLINCPACGHKVSKQAPSCPSCGHPIATETTGVYSVQQTGKSLKLQSLLSLTVLCFFLIAPFFTPETGDESSGASVIWSLGLIGGLVWFMWVQILIWWRHG